jgi:hypothetical protein
MEGAIYELEKINTLISAGVTEFFMRDGEPSPDSMNQPLPEGSPDDFDTPLQEHLYVSPPGATDFDAVYVTKADAVVFFQITIAGSHTFKGHGLKDKMASLASHFKKPLADFNFYYILVTKDAGRGKALRDAEMGKGKEKKKKIPIRLESVRDYEAGRNIEEGDKMDTEEEAGMITEEGVEVGVGAASVQLHAGYVVMR